MLNFIIFKIIVIIGIIIVFLAGLFDIRKKLECVIKNENVKDIKDVSLKVNLFYFEIFVTFVILGILIALFIVFPSNSLFEFALNFSTVTDNYYEEVNKQELLQKAFNTVIDELDDKYTEIIDEDFVESLRDNISEEYGYSLLDDGKNVYISDINDMSIEEMGLQNGDKIISINDNNIKRIKSRRSTESIL